MTPTVASRMAAHDDNKMRICEECNTVASLEKLAQRILPQRFFEIFQASMSVADKRATTKSLFVQCPVSPFKEAEILAKSRFKEANSASLNRPPRVTPSATKKRKTVVVDPISYMDSLETKEEVLPLSPQIACWSVEECHNQIVNRFAQKGTNFLCAITLLASADASEF
jgi:hypothetical protein